MKVKSLKGTLLVYGTAMAVSGVAFGATDGTEGATSTGTAEVSIVKGATVQITGLNDVTLTESGTDYVAADNVCVYSTGVPYNVTMTSSAASGFQLTSGSNTLAYSVTWTDEDGTPATVSEGTPLTGQTSTGDATCSTSGGTNTNFEITVASADYTAAVAGSYTDTLTIVVAPD